MNSEVFYQECRGHCGGGHALTLDKGHGTVLQLHLHSPQDIQHGGDVQQGEDQGLGREGRGRQRRREEEEGDMAAVF